MKLHVLVTVCKITSVFLAKDFEFLRNFTSNFSVDISNFLSVNVFEKSQQFLKFFKVALHCVTGYVISMV